MPTQRTTTDLTAFCVTCPAADNVTAALAPLGFTLTFQMEEDNRHSYLDIAPLPAQYHFRDHFGTEVIYLAGQDEDLGDEDEMDWDTFPRHASRFWLYAGADAGAHEQAAQALTAAWALTWFSLDAVPVVKRHPAMDAVA